MNARQLERVLLKHGFILQKQRSTGHRAYRHPDGRKTLLPFHGGKALKKGLIHAVLKQAGLTVDDLRGK